MSLACGPASSAIRMASSSASDTVCRDHSSDVPEACPAILLRGIGLRWGSRAAANSRSCAPVAHATRPRRRGFHPGLCTRCPSGAKAGDRSARSGMWLPGICRWRTVLSVTAYWRANVTIRQLAPFSGYPSGPQTRSSTTSGPLSALRQRRRCRKDTVLIVDGTLVRSTPRRGVPLVRDAGRAWALNPPPA